MNRLDAISGLYWLVEQLQSRVPAPALDSPEMGLAAMLIKANARRILTSAGREIPTMGGDQ